VLLHNLAIVCTYLLFFRNLVNEIHLKADTMIKNQVRQPIAQVQTLDQISIMHEVRDSLNTIKHETQKAGRTQQICTPCATNTVVIVIATAQALLLIIYAIYK